MGLIEYRPPECIVCGEQAVLQVDEDAFARWRAGAPVEQAFPDKDANWRETLISGIHGSPCFDSLFPEDDDDRDVVVWFGRDVL